MSQPQVPSVATLLSITPPDARPGQVMTIEFQNIPSGAEIWVGGQNTGKVVP